MNKLILFILAIFSALPLHAGELDLQLDEIRSAEGKVIVSLFRNAGAFDKMDIKGADIVIIQRALQGSMRFRFANLVPGEYALVVHHDQNGDGTFNEDGSSSEGYGFSHNLGAQSIPSFEQAKLNIKDIRQHIEVRLIYPE